MKVKTFLKKNISPFAKISFFVFCACLVIKGLCVMFEPFADFFNRHISAITRAAFSYLTSPFPFSVAETVVIAVIPFALLYLFYFTCKLTSSEDYAKHIFNLLALILCLLSVFMINFSIAYDCTPLEDKLDLETKNLSVNDLCNASDFALDKLEELEPKIARDQNGAAIMPYDFDTLVKKINLAYDRLYGEYKFISPLYAGAKQIALSVPMTYTHIAGVYTFFTGEANVNTNYPDYVVAFTTAHEMAHQRGIAPEDEANFIAFLVCTVADDAFLNYCGYAQIVEYIGNSIYETDSTLFTLQLQSYPYGVLGEYLAYANMFGGYSDNTAADVSGAVNDAYLKSQGQSEGTKSYDLVTELATAYILKHLFQ